MTKQYADWRICRSQSCGPVHNAWPCLDASDTAPYPLFGLAELWRRKKKYAQSEASHQRVLAIRQQQLGTEHLDTAESLQALADLYRDWGRYEDAALLYPQVLAIREQILGWESPSLLHVRQTYKDLQQVMEQ